MLRRLLVGAVVLVAGVVGGIVLAVAVGIVRLYRVPSAAMEPTLHCGRPGFGCEAGTSDRVVALRYFSGDPDRGDVVAFRTPPLAESRCGAGGVFVKRVVGLPGERWEERNGVVYVGGERLGEPYVAPARRDRRTIAPLTIEPGHYFVMGDNRSSSCDSREWGTVPKENLIGKVFATYWPPDRLALGRPG